MAEPAGKERGPFPEKRGPVKPAGFPGPGAVGIGFGLPAGSGPGRPQKARQVTLVASNVSIHSPVSGIPAPKGPASQGVRTGLGFGGAPQGKGPGNGKFPPFFSLFFGRKRLPFFPRSPPRGLPAFQGSQGPAGTWGPGFGGAFRSERGTPGGPSARLSFPGGPKRDRLETRFPSSGRNTHPGKSPGFFWRNFWGHTGKVRVGQGVGHLLSHDQVLRRGIRPFPWNFPIHLGFRTFCRRKNSSIGPEPNGGDKKSGPRNPFFPNGARED